MQKEFIDEVILNIGADDSNHASKRTAEIDTLVFSFYIKDGLVEKFGKRANYEEVQTWLNDLKRDYRFTALKDKKFKHIHNNLPYSSPYLIRNFLENYNGRIDKVRLNIDGEIRLQQEKMLVKSCSDIPGFEVYSYTKKRGVHICPKVIYIADSISNDLYQEYLSKGLRTLTRRKKYVPVPQK